MNVVSDVTHQWDGNWLSGHWTMADDPPRVLNVFKCIHELRKEYFGKYLILVTTRPWGKHSQSRHILEEYGELDPLTAQSVVYEMLEKYSDAPIRTEVRAVDDRGALGVVLDKS